MYTKEQLQEQKKVIARVIGGRCLSCQYELSHAVEELENVPGVDRDIDAYKAIINKLGEYHTIHNVSLRTGLDGQPRRVKRRFSSKSMGRRRPHQR